MFLVYIGVLDILSKGKAEAKRDNSDVEFRQKRSPTYFHGGYHQSCPICGHGGWGGGNTYVLKVQPVFRKPVHRPPVFVGQPIYQQQCFTCGYGGRGGGGYSYSRSSSSSSSESFGYG